MNKKIVVIGASAASMSFVSKLRSFDTQSQVVCFSGENKLPYNRCLLADVLTSEKNQADIQLKSEDFFKEHVVDLYLNSWVTALDRERKVVIVNGQEESYDYLFLGIGTQAYIPHIPGIDLLGVVGFHTLSDIEKLDAYIQQARPKNAIVVGAGINGIEAASSLHDRGIKVAIIDVHKYVMPLQVDQKVAQRIELMMQKHGIQIFNHHKVVALQTRNGIHVGRVVLECGASISTDCVVLATGSRVNSKLLQDAGLEMLHGSLVVNEQMQTSDAAIYAGGDICIAPDMVSKELVKSATWSDAMLQGLTAATQFSDKPRTYPGIVGMRDSKFFGYDFYACGNTTDVELFEIIEHQGKEFYHIFYLFDGILKGFVLLGNIENIAHYKMLYMTQQVVDIATLKS